MADNVELQTVGKRHVAGPASAWPRWTLVSVSHLIAAILLLAVACAAAVGLGQEDWYTHQLYAASLAGPSTGNGVIPGFTSNYYGLRTVTSCPFPVGPMPSKLDNLNTAWPRCTVATYKGLRRAAPVDDDQDSAESSWKHLEGAGAIIITMLAIALALAIIGAIINFFHAFHYSLPHWFSNRARHHRMSRLLALIVLICELLAIIFWVTIFPYEFVRDSEQTGGPTDLTYYYSIGTGLGIQIAGFFLALIAFIITGKNPHTHNTAAATPSGGVALPNNAV